MKNTSVQMFKMGCNEMPTSRADDPFRELCGDEPALQEGVQLHISAAKEAGDVTGLTSEIPKSPDRYQKGSFVWTVHLHFTTISFLNHFLQSCYLNFNLTKKLEFQFLLTMHINPNV